jgi:hypothetical protein
MLREYAHPEAHAQEYTEDTRMSGFPIDHAGHAACLQAARARLALLIELQDARTRRLAHVTGCLADPVFRATAPDDVAMLRSHQAALQKIIVLVEHQRTDTQTLVDNLERARPASAGPVSRRHRYLLWRWGR